MKIKIVGACAVAATVWLSPCIAAQDTPECSACLYLYENLYTAFNEGNVINESYMRDQSIVFCNNYEYSHECMEIADQYSAAIWEQLQNGSDPADVCFGNTNSGFLQLCTCGAGEQLSGSSCIPCSRGYYNGSENSSCTRCPRQDGVYGTTVSTGSMAVTDCYLPAGTAFSDTTGSGTYAEDCYYK